MKCVETGPYISHFCISFNLVDIYEYFVLHSRDNSSYWKYKNKWSKIHFYAGGYIICQYWRDKTHSRMNFNLMIPKLNFSWKLFTEDVKAVKYTEKYTLSLENKKDEEKICWEALEVVSRH
jgi:hypothetical protein